MNNYKLLVRQSGTGFSPLSFIFELKRGLPTLYGAVQSEFHDSGGLCSKAVFHQMFILKDDDCFGWITYLRVS